MTPTAVTNRPLKPYYSEAGIELYCGDCREILPTFPADVIDLVFTSPPYNLGGAPWPHLGNWKPGDAAGGRSKWRNGSDAGGGIQYESHDDSMPHAEYVGFQHLILRECWRLLADDGAIFYNHKPRVIGGKLWLPLELNPGLPLRQIIVWARAGGLNFTPVAYVPTHEWIMLFAKEDFRLSSKAASGIGDVWYVPQEQNDLHPAPFPLSLPSKAIQTTTATTVLDPFCGSGSTLLSAKNAGIKAIGIEKSERYCEIAANRLRQGTLFGAIA